MKEFIKYEIIEKFNFLSDKYKFTGMLLEKIIA